MSFSDNNTGIKARSSNGEPRQYLACRFLDDETGEPRGRSYIYHHDGPCPDIGDYARVNSFDGWSIVAIVDIVNQPPFKTKPVDEILDYRLMH